FSHVDRSVFTDDSELNVESLIENLKNIIMKKLSVLYVTESLISLSALSVSFSVIFSQSSTPVSVSDSSAPAISVSVTLTSVTSDFTISAFMISSLHFKKMLYRLNKLYLSFYFTSVSEIILIKDDNTVKTTLSHFQASFITFSLSLFSAEKIVCILNYK
ncbi:hypothetical protein BDDG_12929, partial [Blastomyces dermatitidis ATCC 18188]